MLNNNNYPSDSSEFLINKELGKLIQAVKEKMYTADFKASDDYNTEATELDVLGCIVSKYCGWEEDRLEVVTKAAYEDSNCGEIEIVAVL